MSRTKHQMAGEFWMRKLYSLSSSSTPGQGFNFILNSMRCCYRVIPNMDEEHLIISCPRCEAELTAGRAKVGEMSDVSARSDAAFNSCANFIKNMEDKEFFEKVVEFGLNHGWYSETSRCKYELK